MNDSQLHDAAADDAAMELLAGEISELARSLAPETERQRQLAGELLSRLRASGLMMAGAPREVGGLELAPGLALRCAEEIARGDASAGWCVSIAATSSLLAAYLPAESRDQLFAEHKDEWFPTKLEFRTRGGFVSAVTGVVITLATAAIGFKYPLIIGLISAIAYAVPVIGMLVAQVIALVLCAPQGAWMILWVQVIMFSMARVSDMVLVPKIMGTSIGVSPIGVMFAVFAGGELFGFPGLILGIPAAALIKILWRYFSPWLHASSDSTHPAS